jgi:hypothetical protein
MVRIARVVGCAGRGSGAAGGAGGMFPRVNDMPLDPNRLFIEGTVVDEALRRAAAAARSEYIRHERSMPVWRDGRLVWIPYEELRGYGATMAKVGSETWDD